MSDRTPNVPLSSPRLLSLPCHQPLPSRTRTTQRTKVLPSPRLGHQTFPTISHLDIPATMGRSSGARKKARIKPWHSVYARLNLPQLFNNVIPKRIRAIDSAKARLKTARTVKAAAVEWQLIETNLTAIDGVYSKIRKALRDGYVWCCRSFLLIAVPYVEAFLQVMSNTSALLLPR